MVKCRVLFEVRTEFLNNLLSGPDYASECKQRHALDGRTALSIYVY